ncbi:unnamed protein product, partial [Meganyctiphanes norvegica]
SNQSFDFSSKITSYTIKNLDPCTAYHMSIQAKSQAGNGLPTSVITSTKIEAPSKPVIGLVSKTSSSLFVAWHSGIITNCGIDHYTVSMTPKDVTAIKRYNVNGTTQEYNIEELEANTKYIITVTAFSSYMNDNSSTLSSELKATTDDDTPTPGCGSRTDVENILAMLLSLTVYLSNR